jgi:hypothetical protein
MAISLSSFTNPNSYTKETRGTQLITGFLAGSSFNIGATYSGNTITADPGGMFGWLVYSRYFKQSPAKGGTSDSYIVYTTPNDLVNDLNALGGSTGAILARNTGDTYGLFLNNGNNTLSGITNGKDFLIAINYLAYGGALVITGSTTGFNNYSTATGKNIDVLMGSCATAAISQWLINNPYTTGVFASQSNGSGYTAANFDSLFGSASYVVFGDSPTVADRVFNVYGQKTVSNFNTSSLLGSSTITYTQTAVPDVCGFFARAKDRNELYLTVAGIDRSTVLNGSVDNTVAWSDATLKTILKNNRVNYFLSYNPKFLGQDLVGATAATTDVTVNERVGPAQMKAAMDRDITNIGLKYLYDINNEATRTLVTNEILAYLQQYTTFIDTTQTQVVCDSSNNTDNATTLNILVSVTPRLGVTSFVINVNLSST